MRILSLSAENIQRLSVVEIKPDGSSVVIVAGENEAGKSSCLDAIEMALGGEKVAPPKPVRDGAAKGRVVVDLGEFIVTRTFTAAGGGSLVVTNRDGARYPSPQSLLDGLLSRLTFDPLAFATLSASKEGREKQASILRALAKIDTTDLDVAHKAAYDERTIANREKTRAAAAFAGATVYEGVGTEPESFAALTEELAAADRLADAATGARRDEDRARAAQQAAIAHHAQAVAAVEAARRALAEAQEAEESARHAIAIADENLAGLVTQADDADARVPNRMKLRERIGALEERNRKAAANAAHAKLSAENAEAVQRVENLTAKLNQLESEKAERLAKAAFPIAGLGLNEAGVTWQGLPFEQASTAIRTRVSVAIGAALNPRLKVLLIRNGNDLGAKNLQLLAQFADEAGLQLWVERIAGGDGLQTVVIEDGAVREAVAV